MPLISDFRTFYEINTCTKQGDALLIEFIKDSELTPIAPIEVTLIDFSLKYRSDNEDKFQFIQTSELTLKLLTSTDFDINSIVPQTEREWLVKISINGSLKWFGWILPDEIEEPYESGRYSFTLRASDALNTLKNIPFKQPNGNIYTGYKTQLSALRECLDKIDLVGGQTPIVIFDNTYPIVSGIDYNECPMAQCDINMETYYNPGGGAFSCYDVLNDILAKGCKLFIHDGSFFVVNIQEYELATPPLVSPLFKRYLGYLNTHDTTFTGYSINTIDKECHEIVSGSSNVKKTKSALMTTGYYQYSYGNSQIENGYFDVGTDGALPTNWVGYAAGNGYKQNGKLIVNQGYDNINGYVQNEHGIVVPTGNNVTIEFYVEATDYFLPKRGFINIVIKSDDGYYYTNSGQWVNYSENFRVYIDEGDFYRTNVSISVGARDTDYLLFLGLVKATITHLIGSDTHHDTKYDNVKVSLNASNTNIKQPIGLYSSEINSAKYSVITDPIMFLHADDSSTYRSGGIKSHGVKTDLWERYGQSPSDPKPLITVNAQNQMRMKGRPSVTFEGRFFNDFITILDKISLPTYDNKFKIIGGEFNWVTSEYKFMLSECFYDDILIAESPILEDFGGKSINGNQITPLQSGTVTPPTFTLSGNEFIKNSSAFQTGAVFNIKGGSFDDYLKIPTHVPTEAVGSGQAAMWVGSLSGLESTDGSYTLPIASSTVLGGVKIGSGLSIDSGGVLSVANLSDYYSKTESDGRYAYIGGSNATGTWGVNISGSALYLKANTGTALDLHIDDWSNSNDIDGLFGKHTTANAIVKFTKPAVKGWLNINDGSTLNNNITGTANYATYSEAAGYWGGLYSKYSEGVQGVGLSNILGVHSNGYAYGFSADAVRNWLGLASSYLIHTELPWIPYPGANANTIESNTSAFTYAFNAPFGGTLITFGANNYNTQFNTSYGDYNGKIAFRSRNGDTYQWNSWCEIWHSGNLTYDVNTTANTIAQRGGVGEINATAFYASNWFKSTGNSGWYNQTHDGGIYMSDSTWVRIYSSKSFWVDNDIHSTTKIDAPTIEATGTLIIPTSSPSSLPSGKAAIWIGSLSGITT